MMAAVPSRRKGLNHPCPHYPRHLLVHEFMPPGFLRVGNETRLRSGLAPLSNWCRRLTLRFKLNNIKWYLNSK